MPETGEERDSGVTRDVGRVMPIPSPIGRHDLESPPRLGGSGQADIYKVRSKSLSIRHPSLKRIIHDFL